MVLKEDGIYAGMWKQQLESNKENMVNDVGAVIKKLKQDGSENLKNTLEPGKLDPKDE